MSFSLQKALGQGLDGIVYEATEKTSQKKICYKA